MRQLVVLFIGLILFAGCQKNSSSANPPGQDGVVGTANLSPNTCQVARTTGVLYGGVGASIVQLNKYNLDKADQRIYGEGHFPQNYFVGFPNRRPPRHILLNNALAWKWQIGPTFDGSGKLRIFKEILYAYDNSSYEIDARIVNYGERVVINDTDTNIQIQCAIATH